MTVLCVYAYGVKLTHNKRLYFELDFIINYKKNNIITIFLTTLFI